MWPCWNRSDDHNLGQNVLTNAPNFIISYQYLVLKLSTESVLIDPLPLTQHSIFSKIVATVKSGEKSIRDCFFKIKVLLGLDHKHILNCESENALLPQISCSAVMYQ